jgi:hypothetical protein
MYNDATEIIDVVNLLLLNNKPPIETNAVLKRTVPIKSLATVKQHDAKVAE